METIIIEVEGEDAEEQAEALELALRADEENPSEDNQVVLTRGIESAGTILSIVSAVITSVEMIRTIWKWYQARPERTEADVHIVLPDGTRIEFKDLTQEQLDEILRRYLPAA